MNQATRLAAVAQIRNPDVVKEAVVALSMRGKSYTEIGIELSISRNIVSGIVYRARQRGDARLPPPGKGGGQTKAEKAKSKAIAKLTSDEIKATAAAKLSSIRREMHMIAPRDSWQPARVSHADLRSDHCQWPLWSGAAPKFFCGNVQMPGKPYCQHCASLAYSAPHIAANQDRRLGISGVRRAA
jgi:hypothetical protein